MSLDVLDQLILKVIQAVELRNVKFVKLKLAGGEPLLAFRQWSSAVAKLKRTLESKGVSAKLQVITNGTIATDEILDFLCENEVGLGLSLDGFGDFHNRTRLFGNGKGSFDIVLRNLRKFLRHGLDPYITTVVSPVNLGGLMSLTGFFIEEGLRFRFSLVKGLSFNLHQVINALAECYTLIEKALPTYGKFLSHTLCDLSFKRPVVDTPCGIGRSRGAVNINGSLHSCQIQYASAPLGSVQERRDILEIIQSVGPEADLLTISSSCEECRYRYICGGGCPVMKVSHKSPFCIIFHALLPRILRLRGLTILCRLVEASNAQGRISS